GPRNYFIGTSWGGIVLALFLHLARVKPDKLILNDSALKWSAEHDGYMKRILDESATEFDTLEEAHAHVRGTRFLGPIPEALWNRYLENKIIIEASKYRLAYDPAITGRFDDMASKNFNFYPMLPNLAAPVLLIFGVGSTAYDENAVAELVSKCPNISHVPNIGVGQPPSLM